MYNTAVRVGLVEKRVRQKRRRQETRALCGLSALCLLLSGSLVGTVGTLPGTRLFFPYTARFCCVRLWAAMCWWG